MITVQRALCDTRLLTANDQLDYFGRTVNLAARLGEQAKGGEVVMLEDVFDDARARTTAVPAGERFSATVRGIERELALVRVSVES